MSEAVKDAGAYSLRKFEIKPLYAPGEYPVLDITTSIVNWQMSESINAPYISGSAIIVESWDMLAKMPLRGEEMLTIEYEDYFGDIYSHVFYIYAITDIQVSGSGSEKLMQYTISFCTPQKLICDSQSVQKSYGNTAISTMAEDVYRRYFEGEGDANFNIQSKEIEVQATDGDYTLVIPKLAPDEAMVFLSRRAFTNDNESSLFFFFENKERYMFCTYDYLVEKAKEKVSDADVAESNNLKYISSSLDDNTPAGQAVAQFAVSDLTYLDRSNTIKSMKEGAYKRRVVEIDYYNRTFNTTTYDYAEQLSEFSVIDDLKLINTTDFIERYMPNEEAPEVYYVTDYNQQGLSQGKDFSFAPYKYNAETLVRKSMAHYHLMNSAVSCTINGNGKIKAGDLIYLETYKFGETGGTNVIDNERSGRYLVVSVANIFSGDYFKQKILISKGGLGGG